MPALVLSVGAAAAPAQQPIPGATVEQSALGDQPLYRGILVFGQSNAVGPNLGPRDAGPGGIDALPPNVFCLDRDLRLTPWHLPFPYREAGFDPGSSVNVSAAMALAKELGERFPYERFCVILSSRGNTHFAIDDGDPTRNWAAPTSPNYLPGNLYDDTVARASIAAAQGVEVAYFVGQLGETDSKWSTAEDFEADYRLLIEGFRSDIGPGTFVLSGLPQWETSFGDMTVLDPAAQNIAATEPDVVFANADGLVPEPFDDIHFDAASARILGGRMYTAMEAGGVLHGTPLVGDALGASYGPLPCGCEAVGGAGQTGTILWQDFDLGGWFESYSAALAADAPDRGAISRAEEFERFRRPSGEFRLRASWSTGETITWSQTSNPLLAGRDVVVDFTVIDDPLLLAATGLIGGLARTSISGAVFSFVPGADSITAPVLGQFLTGEGEWTQSLGVPWVVPSPLGALATWVRVEAL